MPPIICLGQQPNGILPKRFFIAKLNTARKLQSKIGGKIVWFLHDADSDPRETRTRIPFSSHPDGYVDINFSYQSKLERKFTPLAKKQVDQANLQKIGTTLRHLTNKTVIDAFNNVQEKTASACCVSMYSNLGLLNGIEIVSSFDPNIRRSAKITHIEKGWFVDVEHEGFLVRAKYEDGSLILDHGGSKKQLLATTSNQQVLEDPARISPGRDTRFSWMQSIIHCTHYVMGKSEQNYLGDTGDVVLVPREDISKQDFAWIP